MVNGDIHHFAAWQQWLAAALFWLNSKPIKCYSLSSYTEYDFNNPLNHSKFLSQPLGLVLLSFCSHDSITAEEKDMKDEMKRRLWHVTNI